MGGAASCLQTIKNTGHKENLEKLLKVIRMLCGKYEMSMHPFLFGDIENRYQKLGGLLSSPFTSKDAQREGTDPQRLQDPQECVACLNDTPVWEFPCKHLVYCKSCMRTAKKKAAKERAEAGKANTSVLCPLCRGSRV